MQASRKRKREQRNQFFLVNVFVEGKRECERAIEDYSDQELKAVGVDDTTVVIRAGKKSAVILDIEEFEGLMELLKEYAGIETYDTEDVTRDIIEAFKDLKKGKIHPAREILNEL